MRHGVSVIVANRGSSIGSMTHILQVLQHERDNLADHRREQPLDDGREGPRNGPELGVAGRQLGREGGSYTGPANTEEEGK